MRGVVGNGVVTRSRKPLAQLFDAVRAMPADPAGRLRPIPPGPIIEGTAFFPGGTGLWGAPRNTRFPVGGVMAVGNTFDSLDGFRRSLERRAEVVLRGDTEWTDGPTWRHLIALLRAAGIEPSECWFTNAYPGLIDQAGGSNIGAARLPRTGDLYRWCQTFFTDSVRRMRPRLILALGAEPIRFVGRLADIPTWTAGSLRRIDQAGSAVQPVVVGDTPTVAVALLHPCLRHANLRRRQLPAPRRGTDPEVALLSSALRLAARATGFD